MYYGRVLFSCKICFQYAVMLTWSALCHAVPGHAQTWRGKLRPGRDSVLAGQSDSKHVSIGLSWLLAPALSIALLRSNNLQYFNPLAFRLNLPFNNLPSLSLSNLQSKNTPVSCQECGWIL